MFFINEKDYQELQAHIATNNQVINAKATRHKKQKSNFNLFLFVNNKYK
jgi:hypothetical protein